MGRSPFWPASAFILLLICFLGAAWITACGGKDDADAIRELIAKGAELAEKKRVGELMDMAAPEFIAMPGGYDNRTARGVLFGAFMHYGKFKLHYPKPAVQMAGDGKSAGATVHFLIVRQDQSIPGLKELYDDPRRWLDKVGEKADLYQLEMTVVKEDGDWVVTQAILQSFKGPFRLRP